MEPDTAKTLGGIGSASMILLSIAFSIYSQVVYVKAILESPGRIVADVMTNTLLWTPLRLIGPILVLLGLRGLGDYYNDEGIKRDSLRWFIWFVVVNEAVSYAIMAPLLLTPNATLSTLSTAFIVSFPIAVIFLVISAIYLRRAYASLAAKSGEGLFNTAAKLYWWGSVLAILLVGLILVWISWIISAVAFFSMKPQQPDAAAAIAKVAPPPPPNAAAAKAALPPSS